MGLFNTFCGVERGQDPTARGHDRTAAPGSSPGLGRGSRSFPGREAGWGPYLVVSRTEAFERWAQLVAGTSWDADSPCRMPVGQPRPPGHDGRPGKWEKQDFQEHEAHLTLLTAAWLCWGLEPCCTRAGLARVSCGSTELGEQACGTEGSVERGPRAWQARVAAQAWGIGGCPGPDCQHEGQRGAV